MWSKDNNMSLHEHKFELVTHSLNKKPASDLPFANEYFTYETRSGELIEASSVVKTWALMSALIAHGHHKLTSCVIKRGKCAHGY